MTPPKRTLRKYFPVLCWNKTSLCSNPSICALLLISLELSDDYLFIRPELLPNSTHPAAAATMDSESELEAEVTRGYREHVLIPEISAQMMFVAGETSEPSSETSLLVEQIVNEQVQEMVGLMSRLHFLVSSCTVETIYRTSYSTWLSLHHRCRSLLPNSS